MRRPNLYKLILLSFILITLTTHLVESTPSVYKSITRKITVLPGNNTSTSEVYVSLTIEGNGTFALLDKTFLNNLTEIYFYNKNSTEIRRNQYFVNIEWRNISVNGRKTIGYFARERAFLDVNVSIGVNGEPIDSIYCSKGYCLIQADAGSYVDYSINLSNRFTINGTTTPLTLIVSANIDSKYLEIVNCSEYPSFVSELGDFLSFTWILTLVDFKNLKITFKVKRLNSWNETTIPSIKILIPLDPRASLKSIKQIEESLSGGISGLENMDNSMANFALFLRNATIMLQNLSYALRNISAMLDLAANQSLEASHRLKEASRIALKSSDQLNDMAKMLDEQTEDLEKIESILRKTAKLLEKMEENTPFLPDQIRKVIKSLKDTINKTSKTLSSLRSAKNKVKNASDNLKKLGIALEESSEGMEELGETLLCLKTIFNETAFLIDRSIDEIEDNVREMEQFFSAMQRVRENMKAELEIVRKERLALEMLCRIYDEEKPYIITRRERKSGFLISDSVVVRIACLKLRKMRSLRFSKSSEKEDKKVENLNYLVISTLLGGASSLGVGVSLKRRKKILVGVKELNEIKELISRIEELNT